MLRYSYDNIIIIIIIIIIVIVINAIMFESKRSASILSFFNTSENITITKASKLLINFSFWLHWRQSVRIT